MHFGFDNLNVPYSNYSFLKEGGVSVHVCYPGAQESFRRAPPLEGGFLGFLLNKDFDKSWNSFLFSFLVSNHINTIPIISLLSFFLFNFTRIFCVVDMNV